MISRRSDQPKLIYFAERKPKMDGSEFQERWRQHARLGMSMPRWKNIYRYVHCYAVEVPGLKLPVAWCDGVAIVWYQDEQSRLNHVSDKSAGPLLKQDEQETFARSVYNFAILTDEYVIKPGNGTVWKLFLRVWRRSEISLANFKSWWLSDLGPRLLARLEAEGICQGYSQNHARPPINGNEVVSICDCVDEISSGDAEALDTAMAEAFQDEPKLHEYIETIKVNWTHETVLHEAQ
jgi:hypothetical protein